MRRIPAGLIALIAAFLLLTAIMVATAGLVMTQEHVTRDVRAAVDMRDDLDAILSAARDAETGQRGYIITRDASYLTPYNEAAAKIEAGFEALARRARDAPEHHGSDLAPGLAALHQATKAKLAELHETIALRAGDQGEAALALIRAGTGRQLMDTIRTLVAALSQRAYRQVLVRQAEAAAIGRRLAAAIAIAIVVTVLLGATVILIAWRRNRQLSATLGGLHAAHVALSTEAANRERLEQQLRQSQKMEALGQLTGGLAHDFNNMLAIVIGNLNLAKRRLERGDPKLGTNLAQALEGAERATILTHRLLAFARRQPLSPQPADLNRIVPNLSELLRRTLGETIQVETVLGGGLWTAHADTNQLESALINMAVNARDAMPEGGRLTIETANAHLDDSYAADNVGAVAGQYVLLAVTDSGAGMTPDVMSRAFDPFFTTKEVGKGTGLGLSQVYGFVKQSAGHIKIYSEAGRGTTMKIYLPRLMASGIVPDRPQADAQPTIPTGSPRELILVVEDEDRVRRMTVETLRDLHYSVIHASGAAHALELLESHPDVTLLFTDVVMPNVGGKQLADTALQQRPNLKVLFTTGYTRNAIVHNGVIDAGVHLIGKPFTVAQLASKIRQVITEKAA